MTAATDLDKIAADLFIWQAYDQAAKSDLFSSAIVTRNRIFVIDPIPLRKAPFAQLREQGVIAGVVITNTNHLRASGQFAEELSVPIFAHRAAFPDTMPWQFSELADGEKICDELHVVGIDGAVAGEIVLHCASGGGTLIAGDALINFQPYGFTFLPGKYCLNEKEMRRSLRKLLTYKTERMLFAHGLPILSKASDRLRQLLDGDL
jgi:hypothetical protein